jgi:hypothetical protein
MLAAALICLSTFAGKPVPPPATLTASCTSCSVSTSIHFSGTGYNPKKYVIVGVHKPNGADGQYGIGYPDASGNISFDRTYILPGTYYFTSAQEYAQQWIALASITINLSP